MKITIVGGGNAGCLTALHYAYYTSDQPNIQIELRHNPDIPAEKVGQATVLSTPCLLGEALGFNWHNNKLDATFKSGILYENWGKKNKEIFHPFPADRMGMHYSPKKLQECILESGLFDVVKDNVNSLEHIDADFIFDCSGKPESFENYEELINPNNSAILGKPRIDTSDLDWTRAVATPDGWCFVIPTFKTSPSHPYSLGYIYNREITNKKMATENFKELFDIDITQYLNFKNYLAKEPIVDDRIILNGNSLFFLEPLESSAVETYSHWLRLTFDWIILKRKSALTICSDIREYVHQVEKFILWHYSNGSVYDTKFWDYAKSLSKDDAKFDEILNIALNVSIPSYLLNVGNERYGQWSAWNFKNWHDGIANENG